MSLFRVVVASALCFRMRSAVARTIGILATGLTIATGANAQSGILNHSEANFASGNGNIAFLGLGVALPLLTDGGDGTRHALRIVDAFLTSGALSEGLKQVIHERRPDGSTDDSFPSGHATAAFAVATMESHYHRSAAPFWYLGAALIADSRVVLRRHYWKDVVAGGALGVGTSLVELRAPRGLLLSPVIRSDGSKSGSTGYALSVSKLF